MYITNIIYDVNNYTLEGLYTNTDLYKNIKAFTNFHRFNCLLFHRKSYSINIMLHFLPKRKKTSAASQFAYLYYALKVCTLYVAE